MIIKKHYYSWSDVENMCMEIVTDMYTSGYKPDYIVGITRGGNVPATIISNMTGIPCSALHVSLRDATSDNESNCWMADDLALYQQKNKKLIKVDGTLHEERTFLL